MGGNINITPKMTNNEEANSINWEYYMICDAKKPLTWESYLVIMAIPRVRVYPARPSDREMTIDRNIMTDPNIMEKEKEWRILYARFPWKHYQTQSIEQKYHVFRRQKMLYISKHLPLSSVCFGGIVFALNVLHFKEERVTAILSTCIFLLVNVAIFSLYCAKEIQTNTSHIVAQFVVVLPFFLLVCVQLLDFRDISASGTRLEWVTFLVFLAFVTLPVRYWVCCAWVFVLFLGQMSTVVFKLLRNGRSHTDILYQVSLFRTLVSLKVFHLRENFNHYDRFFHSLQFHLFAKQSIPNISAFSSLHGWNIADTA